MCIKKKFQGLNGAYYGSRGGSLNNEKKSENRKGKVMLVFYYTFPFFSFFHLLPALLTFR